MTIARQRRDVGKRRVPSEAGNIPAARPLITPTLFATEKKTRGEPTAMLSADEPERDAGQRTSRSAEGQADLEEAGLPLALGWDPINIRHLQEIVAQPFHLG